MLKYNKTFIFYEPTMDRALRQNFPWTPSMLVNVIPKEGENPLLFSSYRPISLLNTGLKLFTKLLPNRLIKFIPDIIHSDQVECVPSREARDTPLKPWLSNSLPGLGQSL